MEVSHLVTLEDNSSGKSRLESIATYERKGKMLVYVGTSEGIVLQYSLQRKKVDNNNSNATSNENNSSEEAAPRDFVAIMSATVSAHRSASAVGANGAPTMEASAFECVVTNTRYLELGKRPVVRMELVPGQRSSYLYCQCDGSLVVLSAESLEPIAVSPKELKGLSCFCAIRTPSAKGESSARVAIAVKKKITFCDVSDRGVVPLTPECGESVIGFTAADNVLTIATIGSLMVVGLRREYDVLDLSTGQLVDQTVTDKGSGPLINRIDDQNALLLRIGNMCVFFRPDDLQKTWDERQRVEWPEEPGALGYCDTYLVGTTSKSAAIYGLLDEFCTPIPNAGALPYRIAADLSVGVLVSAHREIFLISPIPFERLLSQRIQELRIKDALTLFSRNFTGTDDDRKLCVACLYENAAFASFERMHFTQAFTYFRESSLAPRDVLTLFPNYQTRSTKTMIVSKRPDLSLDTVVRDAQQTPEVLALKAQDCKDKLYEYLWSYRDTEKGDDDTQRAIDFALLKLTLEKSTVLSRDVYLQRTKGILLPRNNLSLEEVQELLADRNDPVTLAMLHMTKGSVKDALNIAKDVSGLEGVRAMVDALQRTSDIRLFLEFFEIVMEREPDLGIHAVLVPRTPSLSSELVMGVLGSYPEDLVERYLEHAIAAEKNTDMNVHTLLARIYIHTLTLLNSLQMKRYPTLACRAGDEAGYLGELRRKLLAFLEESEFYDPLEVLGELNETTLHQERVIVYSKSGEYDSALRILVDELKDLPEAEEFCVRRFAVQSVKKQAAQSSKKPEKPGGMGVLNTSMVSPLAMSPRKDRTASSRVGFMSPISPTSPNSQDPFAGNPQVGSSTSNPFMDSMLRDTSTFQGVYKHNEYMATLIGILLHESPPRMEEAMELLTRHATELNPQRILSIIPRTTSVSLLAPYVKKVFGRVSHMKNHEMVVTNVMAGNVLKHAAFLSNLQARSVRVDDKRTCPVCGKRLADSMVAIYPNLRVVHFRCLRDKTLDPVRNVPFICDMSKIN
eukprot:PhM_4_TR4980/c0_g1_i1/m.85430/K20177/VPS3, TGFBRAP1; vacuolar protein sorting-associated protein 3